MKEALIIINLVAGASFLSLASWLVYLRVCRERFEMDLYEASAEEHTSFVADLLGEEVN